jgi:NADH:ubiquinone oxidoreductase subunit 2 (subunit N)
MKKSLDEIPYASSLGLRVVLGVTVTVTLLIGIYPQPIIDIAREAIRPFSP